jgi:hypothetical protein
MRERGVMPTMEVLKALTDKQLRARPLQGRMQQRMVTFPSHAEWMGQLLREFLRFPAGMHDDIVDALAWAITMAIVRASPPKHRPEDRRDREKTVAEKLRAFGIGGGGSDPMAS